MLPARSVRQSGPSSAANDLSSGHGGQSNGGSTPTSNKPGRQANMTINHLNCIEQTGPLR